MSHHGRATTRLRYRFASLAQAQAHLRDEGGHHLFFYRDDKLRMLPYAPVCLEFSFDDQSPARILHGWVVGSLEGSGTWLEILDPTPIAAPAEHNRRHRRMGCDLLVEVRRDGASAAGHLVDLGAGGVRIREVSSLRKGDEVEVRLLSADRLTFRDLSFGRVAWTAGKELGIEFDDKDVIGRSAVRRLVGETEAQWRQAWEAVHPQFCCRDGKVVEPEPPRVRRADEITGKIAL